MNGLVLEAVALSGLADIIIGGFIIAELLRTEPTGTDRRRRLGSTIAALSFLTNGAVLCWHAVDMLRSVS